MFHLYNFLICCFITAYTLEANNLLSTSNTVRLGFQQNVSFNFGILAGLAIVMSVCTAFSATLYSSLPRVKVAVQILGAAYMLYLAWKVWKSSPELSADSRKEVSFLSGMVLQFTNPKIYIYAITAMPLYILPVFRSSAALIGFTIILSLIGTPGSFAWALFGTAFYKFLSEHIMLINTIMTPLLVYCAASLFF